MVSKAQQAATNRWIQKHPEKRRQYQYGSYARKYIRDIATKQQLEDLKQLIEQRLRQL